MFFETIFSKKNNIYLSKRHHLRPDENSWGANEFSSIEGLVVGKCCTDVDINRCMVPFCIKNFAMFHSFLVILIFIDFLILHSAFEYIFTYIGLAQK